MIRRDYILRMIEEFVQILARIKSLKQDQLWPEADSTLTEEFKRLLGSGPEEIANFSDTELLAKVIQGEETSLAVRDKTLMLVTLLHEAGDLAVAQEKTARSRVFYLKGLHLLLDVLARGGLNEFPEFVPKVETFVSALQDCALPIETHGLLMRHYEKTGEFAKAEDALFAMLELSPDNPLLVDFGIAFYRRLAGHSDANLAAGDLPRQELEAGLAELEGRNQT